MFVYIYLIKSLLHRYAQNVTNIEALPYPTTLPEFVPSHQSWAVTNALKDYAWTQKLLPSFVAIDMRLVPKKSPLLKEYIGSSEIVDTCPISDIS